MNKELKYLIKLVKRAAKLITDDVQISAKDDKGDLVTNFDYEIEKFITDRLKRDFPDFGIVSEEYNSDKKLTENCFVLDPIDGTINFAHGLPLWGIQITCIKDCKMHATCIYLPKLGELYTADEEKSYFNGKEMHVSSDSPNKCIYVYEDPVRLPGPAEMFEVSPLYRDLGCSSINFAWTARGLVGGTVFRKETLWDYIPGQHLVKNAGGYILNKKYKHIGANSEELLKALDKNTKTKK